MLFVRHKTTHSTYFHRRRRVVNSITGESIGKSHFRIQNLYGQISPLRYVLTNRKLADPHQGCVSDIFSPKNCGSDASVLEPHPPCVLSVHKLTFEVLTCASPRIRTSKHICSTGSQIELPIEKFQPLSDLERRYAKHLFSSVVKSHRLSRDW
jgi:hypothetical protein